MADLGYGCKAFTLSLVENAIKVSHGKVEANVIAQILDLGKSLLHLDAKPLEGVEATLARIREILERHLPLALSDDARTRIVRCREYLDRKMENPERPVYGITTGFGSLCDISVGYDELAQLQKNLVMSHACGTGERVPSEIVKLILLLKIQSLSYGHSGVQLATVERLIDFFNNDLLPVVYQQGSLGASGDLAPLAHMKIGRASCRERVSSPV